MVCTAFLERCRLFFVAFVALLTSESALAQQVILESIPHLNLTQSPGGTLVVQGEYAITNKGNHPARLVAPIFSYSAPLWSGPPRTIAAGQTESWTVDVPLPEPASSIRGVVPLQIERTYSDENDYRFSIQHIVPLWTPGLTDAERARLVSPAIRSRFSLTSFGEHFVGRYEVENLDERPREFSIRVLAPKELTFNAEPTRFSLNSTTNRDISIRGSNYSALLGSRYPVTALLSWVEDGLHFAVVSSAPVDIFEEKNASSRLYLAIATLLGAGVVLILLLRRFRKDSERK